MTVHGEKKFSCKICGKKFGRNDACIRHEKACGKVFPCSCGCPFNSRTSMLTHAKRNGHTVPDSGTSKMYVHSALTFCMVKYITWVILLTQHKICAFTTDSQTFFMRNYIEYS